jgi:excisionase family DNA binding protein
MPDSPAQNYLSIKEAAELLGVSAKTLRRWESAGKLIPERTDGGHRRYLKAELVEYKKAGKKATKTASPKPAIVAKPDARQAAFEAPKQKISVPVAKPYQPYPEVKFENPDISFPGDTQSSPESAQVFTPLHIDQSSILRKAKYFGMITIVALVIAKSGATSQIFNLPVFRSITGSYSEGVAENSTADNSVSNVLATRDTLLNTELNISVVSNFATDVNIDGQLNLNGNSIVSSGDLNITADGGGVSIGGGTPGNVDLEADDLFVTGDFESTNIFATGATVSGELTAGTFTINAESITDLTGDGVTIVDGALTTSLGTSVGSSEIDDGSIAEVDLNVTNDPTDNQILSYDSSTGTFTWVNDEVGSSSLWTDGGSISYLTATTDDLAIGGTTSSAALYFDTSAGDLSISGTATANTLTDGTASITGGAGTGFASLVVDSLTVDGTSIASSGNLELDSSSGSLIFTGFDCTGNNNGGKLTANASGVIECADDDSGSGASPWQVTSGVVELTTSGNNVTIGSATNYAKFGVEGDTDEIQLLVRGNGTQTSNLVVFENSAGTDQFVLTNSGNLTLTGDATVTGGDLITSASTGNLFNTNATTVNVGGAATTVGIGAGSGTTTVNNALTASGAFTASGTATITSTLTANGIATIGDGGDAIALSGTTIGITSNSAGNDITLTSADDFIFDDAQLSSAIQLTDTDTDFTSGDTAIVDAINTAYSTAVSASNSGWTDGGTVVSLSTTTDEVVIGGASALSSAKVSLDGDTDQIQLIVQGNGTQTTSLAVFEQSDGTDVLTLSNAGNLLIEGSIGDLSGGTLTVADALAVSGALSVTGVISDSDSNLILDDIVDIGSATTGINITVAGAISDIDGNLTLSDNTDINGNLDVSGTLTAGGTDAFIVDASGNITSTGTTGLTFSGSEADILFSGTGTHTISASGGTLQLGAITLGGAVTGNSQNLTGLAQLTVDNIRVDGNTIDTTSGGLTLDSTSGTTTIADILSVTGTINGLTVSGGTISSGTWNGTVIGAVYGGTGQSTVTTGDLLYGSASNTWSRLGIGSSDEVLVVSGGVPTWSTVTGGLCPTCVITNPSATQTITQGAGTAFALDSDTTNSTLASLTAGVFDINVGSTTGSNVGFTLDYTSDSGVTLGEDLFGGRITVTQNDADGDLFGLVITSGNTTTASASTDDILFLSNADTSSADGGTVDNALRIGSSGGTITDAIDLTSSNITNAINLGANDIIGTTADINLDNFDVVGSSGNVTAGTYNSQTISSTANFTGTVTVATSVSSPIYTGTGAVTLSSAGSQDLTLDASSGTIALAAGDALEIPSGSITSSDAAITIDSGTANSVNIGASDALSNGTWTISGAGALTGITTITASGAISAATDETINGIDISSGTVTDVANLTINGGGDLTIGSTSLNEATSGTDTGAFLVGAYTSGFTNSSSATVQEVLEDFDSAIGAGSSKWTASVGTPTLTYLTETAEDLAVGGTDSTAEFYIDIQNGGNVAITSTGDTENLLGVTGNSLTTGTGLALSSTATAFNGELLTLTKTGASGSTAYTSDIANIAYSQTFNGGVGLNSTGNVVDISRAITLNNTGNTHTISGAVTSIVDSGTQTDGTLTHTGNVLFVDQNYASSTGDVLALENAGTGDGIQLTSSSTGNLINLIASGTGTTPAGITIANTSTGTITTALDVSDAEIDNAISIGANAIAGTNFSVATGGTITIASGQTLTIGTTSLNETTGATDTGAVLVGVFNGTLANAPAATNVQEALDAFDNAIGGGASKWSVNTTPTPDLLYPTSSDTPAGFDLAVGGTTITAAPFAVDVSANTIYLGDAATAGSTSVIFKSDAGGDTGTLLYNTGDQFEFSGGDVLIDQTLTLSTGAGAGINGGGLVDCDGATQKLVWDATTEEFACGTDGGSGSGSSKWTDNGTITYLTETSDDLIVGSDDADAIAPFYIDVSANTVRIGDASVSGNATLSLYGSDGDTGNLIYNTSDQFNFAGGDVLLDQNLSLANYSITATGSRVSQTTSFDTTASSQTLDGSSMSLTNNPTTNANTVRGDYITINDAGSLANTVYGGYIDVTTANANDAAYGLAVAGDTADILLLGGNINSDNVAITLDSGSANSITLGASDALNLSGNFTQSGATTLTSGTGQVTLAGNVDATNGLDVTTANLTVGGANFTVAPGTGNTTILGTLGVTGLITASGGVTLPANQDLTLSSGTGQISQTYADTTGSATTINATNSAASGTNTVNGIEVALTGTANAGGTNTNNALRISGITDQANNTFTALSIGDNYDNLIVFENGGFTGTLQDGGITGNQTYTFPDASGEICLDSNNCTFVSSFTVSGESGNNQTITSGDTLNIAAGTGIDTVGGGVGTDILTVSIQNDSLDFAQFEDTLDLDAALTLNQGANAIVQNYTSTGTAETISLTSTGTALSLTSSSTGALASLTATGTGTTTTAFSIANTSSGAITTAVDVSDAEIATAIAIGTNDVTVGGATIESSEFALLDGRSGTLVDSANVGTYATTAVTAGAGLTGGGTTGALTLNAIAGTGITVNADDIQIDTSVVPRKAVAETITGGWTFNTAATTFTTGINANGGITTSSGNLALASTGGTVAVTGDLTATGTINGLTVSGGTISSGTWNGTAIGAVYGGTGLTSVSEGDLLYGSAANTWSNLAVGSDNEVLIVSGGVPTWSTVTGGLCPTCVITNPSATQTITHGASTAFALDSDTTNSTLSSLTAGAFDLNVGSVTGNNTGFTLDYTSDTGVTAGEDLFGARFSVTQNDADGDLFGLVVTNGNTTTASASTDDLLLLTNADTDSTTNGGTVDNALRINSLGATITDAIDASDTEITNAINIGANNIEGTNFDVDGSTGAITVAAGGGLDTNGAGALALGNTNATSVSICNSATCDTISIGTNTDADTITIGDSTDNIAITDANWSITGAGVGTFTQIAVDNLDLNTNTLSSTSGNLIIDATADVVFDDAQITAAASTVQLSDADGTLPNSNTGIIDAINDAWDAATGSGSSAVWTDGGTTVYLTDTTDELVLGASSPIDSAKFSIDGDADQAQLIIQGNGTQTANLLEIETSAAANLLTVTNAGNLAIEGTLSDITQDTLTIDDDLQVNGNDIKDSGGTARLTLGATTTVTGDTFLLSGVTTITAASASTFNCADCINFDDLSDSLSLDAATTITNGITADLTLNLSSSGDFVIQDGGVDYATFSDGSVITFAPANATTAAGRVLIDGATTDSTATLGLLDINFDSSTTGGVGIYNTLTAIDDDAADTLYANRTDITVQDDTTASDTVYGQYIDITQNDTTPATTYGLAIVGNDSGAAAISGGILIDNLQATDIDITDAILIRATTADSIADAIDVSDEEITNALNIGANNFIGTTPTINFTNFDVSSGGEITIAAGAGIDTNGAGTLDLGVTNATAIVAGSGSLTSFTITTDSTGDAEVVLPTGSIATGEILDDTLTTSDLAATLTFSDGDLVDLSSIVHDDATAQGLKLPQTTSLTAIVGGGEGYLAYDTDDNQVLYFDGTSWNNISGASTTLQQSYTNDVDGSDAIIALTSADGSLIFRNPDATGTSSAYLLNLDNADTTANELTDYLILTTASTDTTTDAIDVSDSGFFNAINIGANAIAGTNFSVTGAGAVTGTSFTDGTATLTGGALTGVSSLDTIATSATALTFAGAGTISSTTSSALTIDTGTTGTLNLGTGNNAKTINLGTGTAGNTVNIGTDNTVADTINIGSALDTTTLTGTINVAGLSASSGVYTDGSSNLTSTPPTSGTLGYWSRSGTALSPANAGDDITLDDGDFIGLSSTTERLTFNGTSDFVAVDDASFRVYDAGGTDYIDIAHDGTDINVTSANTTALNITSTQVEIGDGTDYLQISTVGDLTFVDADGAASITGPAGGALSVVAGASQALTLTGNGASTWSTTAGDLTVDSAAGSLNLTSGENADDSIVISSDAGGIDITTNSTEDIDISASGGLNLSSSEAALGAITLSTSNAAGNIALTSSSTTVDAFDFTADSVTTGNVFDISADVLTSGSIFNVQSTSISATAPTNARLGYFDWSPGSSTTIVGDLLAINIGTNGSATNLLNITDNGSTLFRVSEAQIESAVPHAFTSAGDVSFSYDAIFTNQTASQIESYGPFTIIAGESFESNDLTFQTYNSGNIILDNATNGTLATFNGSTGNLQLGAAGLDGSLTLYNELGATDYTVSFTPSASQTETTAYTLPTAHAAANDYVLTAQTDGTLAWQSVAGVGGVNGSGSDGQISYFTAADTIASDANFLWDDGGQVFGVNGTSELGDGGSTNYASFSTTGDLTFVGSADTIVGPATFNLLNTASTTVNFAGAATALNIADGAITGTIDIGGVTADGATTVNVATEGTSSDTIAIGNSNASTTVAITGGNDWNIDAAGDATFEDITAVSFTDSTATLTGGALTGVSSLDTIATSATALTFAGAGTISSTTSSAVTLDSGTTGAVNVGTGNNAKTINIGTGTAGNTVNIGTDNTTLDTISIGSALDDVSLTDDDWSISTAGVFTTSTGSSTSLALTRSSAGQWISFADGTDTWGLYNVAGSPEGALTANIGALAMDTTNGTLYVKTTADGTNTNWTNLATGGSSPWTDGSGITYLTDTAEDLAVGGSALASAFSVDIDTNTVRIGDGADANGVINMYASDGDTGSITYNTSDTWAFSGGAITTDGNFTTTSSGTITSAGLLTGSSGLTVTGTTNINASNNAATNIGTGTTTSTVTIGGGSNALATNSTTTDIDATGAIQINSSGGTIGIGNDAVAQAINIGTGAAARTITIGNNTGASALALTSGTGAQTFTSSAATSGAFAFVGDSITTSTALDISADGLTTGNGLNLASTTTSTSFSGNVGYVEWAPGSSTSASGDVFQVNIGTNGTTTGYILNVTDTGSTVFGVSETKITSALPHEFTAAGDASFAYDINLTNQTSSTIESNGPFSIIAGEPAENNSLTFKTYGTGDFIFDNDGTTVAIVKDDGTVQVNLTDSTSSTEAICGTSTSEGASNSVIDDCTTSVNADYAEIYPTEVDVEYGDVVIIGPNRVSSEYSAVDDKGEIVSLGNFNTSKLAKSSSAYQPAIGIVSNNWSDFSSTGQSAVPETENPMPVALSGRVPVKVATTSDPILAGDWITTSSEPGKAMKATESGFVIGRALASWEPGLGQETVLVFVNNFYYVAPTLAEAPELPINAELENRVVELENQLALVQAQLDLGEEGAATESFEDLTVTNLSVLGDTTLGDTVITGNLNVGTIQIDSTNNSIDAIGTLKIQELALGDIEFMGGLITFDTNGNVTVNEITANKYNVAGASAGKDTLPIGVKKVFVETNAITTNSLVFVTPKRAIAFPLSVTSKVDGQGFWVEIPATQSLATDFDWWIIDHVSDQQ